jgi:hypothetical protein
VRLVIALGLAATATGCATSKAKPKIHTQPSPITSERTPVLTPPVEKELESLAAVEDFLERTQQYRLSKSAIPGQKDEPTAKTEPPAATAQVVPSTAPPDQTFANTQVALPESSPPQPLLAIPAVQSVSIRSPEPKQGRAAEPIQSNTTNSPLDAQPADASASVDRLLTQLRNQVNAKKDFEAEWQLRLVELAFDRDAQAFEVSTHLSERSRVLLATLMQASAAIRDAARDPLQTGEKAIAHVDQLRTTVADQADPVVSTVALCRKVITFGAYEEMPPEDFVSGRTTQTIVYSEISNLRAEQTDAGLYQTRIGTRLEVLSADGKSIWQREEPEIVDTCRRRRGDFFIAQRITLPPTLPAGDYVLKVFIEDKISAKADESTRPFTISSPLSLAKGKP